MKLSLLILTLLMTSLAVDAKVEMKSFYFKSNTNQLQSESQKELERIKQSMNHSRVQIIELNAFTENTPFNTNDKFLAQKRIDQTLKLLQAENQNITINNFGNERIGLDFTPLNWERVDIYFVRFAQPEELQVNTRIKADTSSSQIIENKMASIKAKEKDKKEANNNETSEKVNQLNLHLNFIGGTAQVQSESRDNLGILLEILQKTPSLKANIRGHVCCGNNMRLSKKRAKAVYRFLIQSGIDKKRLDYEGLSNSEPLVEMEMTAEDRKKNRRVEVVFNEYIQL